MKKAKRLSDVGKRIDEALELRGISQTAAERAWLGEDQRGYLGRVMRGERGSSIEPEKLFRLADVLGVSARWLWTGLGPRDALQTNEDASVAEAAIRKKMKEKGLPHTTPLTNNEPLEVGNLERTTSKRKRS